MSQITPRQVTSVLTFLNTNIWQQPQILRLACMYIGKAKEL